MYYDKYVPNELVRENAFIGAKPDTQRIPGFAESRHLLPKPAWEGHGDVIDCYWRAWELAFGHLRAPNPDNGFIANYIDTAFNNCLFMWDSSFILMFGKYGRRAFDFQRTLDNLYCKQHPDGFICREIKESDGADRFHRFDPVSTGPNTMPWAEWEYYLTMGDKERLAAVFPVLTAYHRWLRINRTWPDGTYWATGWACGMDSQPRLPAPFSNDFQHGHHTWVDTCIQQAFSATILGAMARELGRDDEVADMAAEARFLADHVNARMWDDKTAFYHDTRPDGTTTGVIGIGAYWALIAGIVPGERLDAFLAHLENEAEFKRPHMVPALAATDPHYDPAGYIWNGSVWAPTNYMVMRGLTRAGRDAMAHSIAMNHVARVVEVFLETGTLWENYAPETAAAGAVSRRDFVGWTGLAPIAVLFEYVFGLRPDVPNAVLEWDIRLMEAHGIEKYPFGTDGLLDLHCDGRSTTTEKPRITVGSNVPLTLIARWDGGSETVCVEP